MFIFIVALAITVRSCERIVASKGEKRKYMGMEEGEGQLGLRHTQQRGFVINGARRNVTMYILPSFFNNYCIANNFQQNMYSPSGGTF